MYVSLSKKFIFIHNYKAAGTSIRAALSKQTLIPERLFYKIYGTLNFDYHRTALDLKKIIPPLIFNNFYKFGFVRNPWDLEVSHYTYVKTFTKHPDFDFYKQFKTFEAFVDWRVHNKIILQKSFFYDNDNQCLVNFIGKYEKLKEDYTQVCTFLNLQNDLPFYNKSRESGKKFLDYYNEKSIELVNQAYQEDIILFNYKKPII
jgi:Sulfotransferase family